MSTLQKISFNTGGFWASVSWTPRGVNDSKLTINTSSYQKFKFVYFFVINCNKKVVSCLYVVMQPVIHPRGICLFLVIFATGC